LGPVDIRGYRHLKRLAILTNGPGELWCWVRPVVPQLKKRGFHVTVWVLPCQFASGEEGRIAETLDADDVRGPASVISTYRCMDWRDFDAVLQMGGDRLFGRRLSKDLIPLFRYGYIPSSSSVSGCARYFSAFAHTCHMPRHVGDKVKVVGDLAVDGLDMEAHSEAPWKNGDAMKLVFFPGSRKGIRLQAMGYLGRVAEQVRKEISGVEIVTACSPFMPPEEKAEWARLDLNPVSATTAAVFRDSDLALTQPGTNTLELAYLQVPMLVAAPFEFIRNVPLSGIPGILDKLPFIGRVLKERYARNMRNRNRFLSWPNRLQGKEIVPEAVGELSPMDVAAKITELLRNRDALREIQRSLGSLDHKPGAAATIAERLSEMV